MYSPFDIQAQQMQQMQYNQQMQMQQMQQMAQMQQMQQMSYGQQMPYNQQMGYGQQIKYTRAQYLEGLRNFVISNTGCPVLSEERLEDLPQGMLRHACAEAKISFLTMCQFYVPETMVTIPFYFCKACGKLFYLRDFM